MKKFVCVLLLLSVFLSGCASTGVTQAEFDALQENYDALKSELDALKGGSSSTETPSAPSVSPSTGSTSIPAGKFDEETVLSQLEVTQYTLSNSWGKYAFLAVKNNSAFTLDISVAAKFYNAEGKLIAAKDDSHRPVGSGTEALLILYPDDEFASMEYELSVNEETWLQSPVSDLTYESTAAKSKEILSITNSGSEAAKYVEGAALFFDGDSLVDYDRAFFGDNDSELKSGKTITKELFCDAYYDSVKFFLAGEK